LLKDKSVKYLYPGAIHIHSKYSDGSSTIPEIAQAAKKAGLAWIAVTDHNSLEGLKNGEEGWHDGVAVIIGDEISPELSDHYIALDINENISCDQSPEKIIEEVKKHGGIGFVAHPDESLSRKYKQHPLRWTDWNIRGFDGIEIWNYLSDWVDNYNPKNPFYHFFFKNHTLTGPTEKTLKWWDVVNNETPEIIPAIGGVDAHALSYKFGFINIKIFPYIDSFNTITNILYIDKKLSSSFEEAKKEILTAVKTGRNTIINRIWAKSLKYPVFYIEDKDTRVFPGESIKLNEYTKAVVKLPVTALIRLIQDGQLVWEYEDREMEFDGLNEGKYRVEVYYKNHPWVFSNPVKVIS
jgi:hypothetical protein